MAQQMMGCAAVVASRDQESSTWILDGKPAGPSELVDNARVSRDGPIIGGRREGAGQPDLSDLLRRPTPLPTQPIVDGAVSG